LKHRRRLKIVFSIFILGLIAGCAQLPDYARPQFHIPENGSVVSRTGFAYRPLTVQDFQAASLPPEYSAHNHHINAHSCISIRPAEDSKARITQGVYGKQSFYVGSIPQVTFEAIFVPGCSWWNPDVPEGRKAYVLQHEQIHFALAELAARQLTRDAREALKDYLAINDSYREVQEELKTKLKDMAHAAMKASFEEHTDFDKDTSLRHDPRAQRWWLEEVEERLAEESAP
jgi:hypothetical protein